MLLLAAPHPSGMTTPDGEQRAAGADQVLVSARDGEPSTISALEGRPVERSESGDYWGPSCDTILPELALKQKSLEKHATGRSLPLDLPLDEGGLSSKVSLCIRVDPPFYLSRECP